MATAKKLPSGSWRCLVFSHYEYVTGKDGNVKRNGFMNHLHVTIQARPAKEDVKLWQQSMPIKKNRVIFQVIN